VTRSIYDHRGGPYDAAYFSASFMLPPTRRRRWRISARCWFRPGVSHFTQTFEHRPSRAVERSLAAARLVTTIDFGRVTTSTIFVAC
jgi:hypothetical protein